MLLSRFPIALLLAASVFGQNVYVDHLHAGDAFLKQRDYESARKEYLTARAAVAGNPTASKQVAIASWRMAKAFREEGKSELALNWYRDSLKEYHFDQVEQEEEQLELDLLKAPKPASEIKKALTVAGDDRTPSAEPNSIDLEILFGFNDARISAEGAQQVKELAEALKDASLARQKFLITGHTDSVGSDEYNLKLSLERAKSVQAELVSRYGIPAGRLACEGKGKRSPKHKEDSPEAQRLNRRVQVSVVE